MKTYLDTVLEKIEKAGLTVHQFTLYHVRIAGRFDIFPSNRGNRWAWHDRGTGKRGTQPADQFVTFIPTFFQQHPVEPKITVSPTPRGWWNCPLCTFKMRDDGTSAAARRQLEHLETHP